MIRDKLTGDLRDFAFVEFFSIEEAQYVIDQVKINPIFLRENQVFVTFSKIRRSDEVRVNL
jgi:RNA recognition motif-containing protein